DPPAARHLITEHPAMAAGSENLLEARGNGSRPTTPARAGPTEGRFGGRFGTWPPARRPAAGPTPPARPRGVSVGPSVAAVPPARRRPDPAGPTEGRFGGRFGTCGPAGPRRPDRGSFRWSLRYMGCPAVAVAARAIVAGPPPPARPRVVSVVASVPVVSRP